MADVTTEPHRPDEPDVMRIFDEGSHDDLNCRVCGCLVARSGDWPRLHWDWHEAANGA